MNREKLHRAMREIGAKADGLIREHEQLRPKFGTVAMGSSWMSPFFVGDALHELLSRLRKGDTVAEAEAAAKKHARVCIKKWNAAPMACCINHKSELMYWPGHCDDAIETAVRLIAERQK